MDVFYVMLAITATGVLSVVIYIFRHKISDVLLGKDRDATVEDIENLIQRNKFSSYLPCFPCRRRIHGLCHGEREKGRNTRCDRQDPEIRLRKIGNPKKLSWTPINI